MSTPVGQEPLNRQQANAQVKASKAQAKAMRPWFRKKRFWLLGPIVLIVIIAWLSGYVIFTATKAAAPAAAKIGDTVRAGDFRFEVTEVMCGVSRVGDQNAGKKAQGQFCLVNLSVTNIGTDPGTLVGSSQKLLAKDGRTFSTDDAASLYAHSGGSTLFEEINPGNTRKGVLVFDLPKKADPVQVQLAGGRFGVKDVATVDLNP